MDALDEIDCRIRISKLEARLALVDFEIPLWFVKSTQR